MIFILLLLTTIRTGESFVLVVKMPCRLKLKISSNHIILNYSIARTSAGSLYHQQGHIGGQFCAYNLCLGIHFLFILFIYGINNPQV